MKGSKAVIKDETYISKSTFMVEIGDLDVRVDRDGLFVYACSQRKGIQE